MADKNDSVLAFRVSDERYGVRLNDIKEILSIPFEGILSAPSFPECVIGIINVRGKIVPVLDTWLLTGENKPDKPSRTIVCLFEHDGEVLGFAADELLDTADDFEFCDETPNDGDKIRLCPVYIGEVNGISTGLIKTGELYAVACVSIQEGSGA